MIEPPMIEPPMIEPPMIEPSTIDPQRSSRQSDQLSIRLHRQSIKPFLIA
ncbi:hypothetical protein [Pseudoduganella albidiflava]|nr:hypothetical protein [Pseudoduganella albidiflava]